MAKTKADRIKGKVVDVFRRVQHPRKAVRNPALCMYHSISAEADRGWGPWRYSVTPETFEQQIHWLVENKTPVAVDQVVDYLAGKASIPTDAVVITFDDGYQDYLHTALPILEEYEVPSIVYIPTKLMREQVAPYEFRLAGALLKADNVRLELSGESATFDLSTTDRTQNAYSEITDLYKVKTFSERNSLIDQLGGFLTDGVSIMDAQTIQELGSHPLVTIGSHSHEHRPLRELSPAEVETNMSRSRKVLTDILGQSVSHFSFPYGSTAPQHSHIAAKVGYECAVTTEPRVLGPRDWRRYYTLPRIDMSNLTGTDTITV